MEENKEELYSETVGNAQEEFEVIFRAINGQHLRAYVYADNEKDARYQAKWQGIDMHSIRQVIYVGKRRTYGHI